jgi:hypothetical protein
MLIVLSIRLRDQSIHFHCAWYCKVEMIVAIFIVAVKFDYYSTLRHITMADLRHIWHIPHRLVRVD